MKKILTFFVAIGFILIGTNSFCSEFTSADVGNVQFQNQISGLVPVGNGNSIDVGFQRQGQIGTGIADDNSIAGDGQIQNSATNGTSITAIGGGIANGGDYRYMNGQGAVSVQTIIVTPSGTQDVSGAIGGMGAITQSTGNAISFAGGELVNGAWSMSNGANSITKPVSINIDGYLNY